MSSVWPWEKVPQVLWLVVVIRVNTSCMLSMTVGVWCQVLVVPAAGAPQVELAGDRRVPLGIFPVGFDDVLPVLESIS